jgi:3-methylcrotonyl-CoA carboxylase alpha subunit
MTMKFTLAGDTHDLSIRARHPGLELLVDGRTCAVKDGDGVIEVNGVRHEYVAVQDGTTVFLRMAGRTWVVDLVNPRDAATEGAGADSVSAPMPGLLVSIQKQAGDRVLRGDPVLTIESMKLQLTLEAPRDGVIEKLVCAEGETFDKGATLFEMVQEEVV